MKSKTQKKDIGRILELIPKKIWLTQEETEIHTGLSRKTLQNLRTKGTWNGCLPFRRVGGTVLYNRKEVDEYFNSHKVTL